MGEKTGISWTNHTFNPFWGCTRVSPGCFHCYAETLDHRWGGDHWGPGKPRKTFGQKHWNEPLKWNKQAEKDGYRHRVFCASMADVFDEEAPKGELERLWELIRQTPMLDWQLLTKRPERIEQSLPPDWNQGYDNVWLGTSVENNDYRYRAITLLKQPAKVRFLSLEPLLDQVDLTRIPDEETGFIFDILSGIYSRPNEWHAKSKSIDWVIVGGESGQDYRIMNLEWARQIRDNCVNTKIPFFFKQVGGIRPTDGGDLLDGVEWKQFPGETK